MKISVVLATYNGARFLCEQLESFLVQTSLPDEIVVSDDCSTDSTRDILEDFRRRSHVPVVLAINERNLGHRKNFERALAMCAGDLVFLSDQDDRWQETKIEMVASVAAQHPEHDVFINDAFYADEYLVPTGATVLARVEGVGASSSGHIAGACTAVTQRFLRFILPFPTVDCPQHDVYIHRWANLLRNKTVIRSPLQLWRIHSTSATAGNEMHSPLAEGILARYSRGKDADSAAAYELKAREYAAMADLLQERRAALSALPAAPSLPEILEGISSVMSANVARARVARAGRVARLPLVARMLLGAQYRHFKGLKSVAKDLIR